MSVKIYIDYISQPSRAVLAYCKFTKIPFQPVEIRLNKKMHLTEDYKKINPLQKVPALDDNGFILTESHAIMTYLARRFDVEEPLYPKDPQKRARVDSYLHWHHNNTRTLSRLYQLRFKQFLPYEIHYIPEVEEENAKKVLTTIDQVLLKDKKFIADKENMTIADISAVCELNQLEMLDYDISAYKNVKRWIDEVMSHKEMQEAHETFFKLSALSKSKKA
jgi:Glutathione S-transferase